MNTRMLEAWERNIGLEASKRRRHLQDLVEALLQVLGWREEEEAPFLGRNMPRYRFLVLDEAIQPFELCQMVFQLLLRFPDVRKLTLEVPLDRMWP